MWFSTFIFKNVTRRMMRSSLTAVAMALGVAAVVSLVGIAEEFENSFSALYREAKFDLVVFNSAKWGGLAQAIPESLEDRMRDVPGVKEIVPGLTEVDSLDDGMQVPVQGYRPETSVFDHYVLKDGRKLKPGDTNAVMIGTQLAANTDVKVGDSFMLLRKEWKVVGIFETANFIEKNTAIVPLEELQKLSALSRPEEPMVTGFFIVVDEPESEALERKVKADLAVIFDQVNTERADVKNLKANLTSEHAQNLQEIKLGQAMAWLTSTVALIIGAVGMVNTMLMSVQERTKEIGILRAIGWRKSRVMKMIVGEAMLLSGLGAVLGVFGGILLTKMLTMMPPVRSIMQGQVPFWIMAVAAIIALLIGTLAGMLPAYRAARLAPTSALRYE